MSSSTGWQTKQTTGNLSYNDSGWGVPNTSSSVSSPLSHPDSWPQLGAGQDPVPKLDSHHQGYSDSNMQQHQEPTGWGAPPPSNSAPATGWGMPPQQASGWGAAPSGGGGNWNSRQVDNGTALWGKQSQSGSGWGVPSNNQPPVTPTSWGTPQPPPAPTSSGPSSSGAPHQEEQPPQSMPPPPQSSSNPAPSQPESWAAAAAATPSQSHSGNSQPPQSSSVAQPVVVKETEANQEQTPHPDRDSSPSDEATGPVDPNEIQMQKLVNSHEGWGKRPIQQNTSWDISDSPSYSGLPTTKTGTEAWGKAPPGKPAPSWQGGAGPTAANPPVRGWGPMNSQTPMPPRPPWSQVQPNNPPPPQTGWGDPRLPSPANPINTNRWGTPSNPPMPNTTSQGWGAPNIQQPGWNTSGASGDNSGWGNNVQRNPPNSNWGVPPPRPEGTWNQPQNMQRQSSMVDDGTSAWGDPTAYKSVNMWDKKASVGGNMGAGDAGQNKPEPVGWGAPPPLQNVNNKPSPTGWGDINPSKSVDDGASSWNKTSQAGSNWGDQGQGWGMGKTETSNGWGGNTEQTGPQWGQQDNDLSRSKSNKDFGFIDRKTSTGSDSVFEEGQLDRNGNGLGGDIGGGSGNVNYGQFPVASANNSAMPGLNGPRPMPPQNLMGLQGQYRQAPPQMPTQLQNQLQQIRHAVMKGVIPPQVLNPQLMTPQHLNHLQQLIMKTTEYQQLSARMGLISKQPNIPPQMRSQQQEQIGRMLRQLQQQIQALQRALTQNAVQKSTPLHDKGNMGGLGPNLGLGLDLPSSSGAMPPNNSIFNMSSISQSLQNPNREQQSRLHTWRRPSAGFENSSDNSAISPVLPPSISEMISGSGLLNSQAEQGGLLGLQHSDNNDLPGSQEIKDAIAQQNNGLLDPPIATSDADQDPSHLKKILAEIGPPEFIPGKKWTGFRPIDPESDPDITPGSVAHAKTMSVNTVKDVDQVLNRERHIVSQTDNTALNTVDVSLKTQPALASSFANVPNDNPSTMASSAWSTGPRWAESNKVWVVLSNISPQLDFNTLRNLCSTNWKMVSFQANFPMRGMAVAKYQTAEDADAFRNTYGGQNMFTVSLASDQEIGNILNSSGNNWNPGSSGRRLFSSPGNLLGNQPPGPPSFSRGPMMPNTDMPFGGDAQNLWSTVDNGAMHNTHGSSTSWSTGSNHAPGRPMGMGGMWNTPGPYDNPRVISPPHNLLPENLLGEQQL